MMSGIEVLPDDLLSEILLLATDISIDDKLAAAQVSRRWRGVALASPLLWSSFRLATKADYARIPDLLNRSGTCSLDIALHPDSLDAVEAASVEMLAQQAVRIRLLDIDGVEKYEKFGSLLNADLHFPALETLRVSAGPTSLRIAEAPALRVLRLALVNMDPGMHERLLGSQLTSLHLCLCTPVKASDILPIAVQCPRLVRLFFRAARGSEPAFIDQTPISHRPISASLVALELCLPCADTLEVLTMDFSTVPRDILAQVTGELDGNDMMRICGALLRGADALVAFELKSYKKLVLRDAVGRVRTFVRADSDWQFLSIRAIWHELATQDFICTSLKTLEIPASRWNVLVDALAEHPVQSSNGVTLRIVLDNRLSTVGDDRSLRRIIIPHLRDLTVGELDCVELVGFKGTQSLAEIAPYFLNRLHSNHTRTIRFNVKKSSLQLEDEEIQAFQMLLRSHVAREAQGNWDVSFV